MRSNKSNCEISKKGAMWQYGFNDRWLLLKYPVVRSPNGCTALHQTTAEYD
ncbi:hypothetical protein [Paenibacillus sp. JNUCC31]|uniref:hypothetical protein n=1 Tax=Paenibacillus sp. JNUCC-31 TaxID=2777983 RepID=UPI001E2E76B0|nr:hypothetical protein [Paenibacillus sp. JNUCC-31]